MIRDKYPRYFPEMERVGQETRVTDVYQLRTKDVKIGSINTFMDLLEKPQKGLGKAGTPYCDPRFISNMPGLEVNVFKNPDGYSTPSSHFDALLSMALNEYMIRNPAIEINVVGRHSAIVCFRAAYPQWANNFHPNGKRIYIQDIVGYENDQSMNKLLVRFQPHLQLEESILPMREGYVCIAQNKVITDVKRAQKFLFNPMITALNYVGAFIDHIDYEWQERLTYRFDGGDSFDEPMLFYNGSIIRIMLPNADIIVTQADGKEVGACNLPINLQKDRMLNAIEELKGLKSAQAYKEFWSREFKTAVNRPQLSNKLRKNTKIALKTQYHNKLQDNEQHQFNWM